MPIYAAKGTNETWRLSAWSYFSEQWRFIRVYLTRLLGLCPAYSSFIPNRFSSRHVDNKMGILVLAVCADSQAEILESMSSVSLHGSTVSTQNLNVSSIPCFAWNSIVLSWKYLQCMHCNAKNGIPITYFTPFKQCDLFFQFSPLLAAWPGIRK